MPHKYEHNSNKSNFLAHNLSHAISSITEEDEMCNEFYDAKEISTSSKEDNSRNGTPTNNTNTEQLGVQPFNVCLVKPDANLEGRAATFNKLAGLADTAISPTNDRKPNSSSSNEGDEILDHQRCEKDTNQCEPIQTLRRESPEEQPQSRNALHRNISNELVPFKNLDSGQVVLVPIDFVNNTTGSIRKGWSDKNRKTIESNYDFFDIFNSTSTAYKKLQRYVERMEAKRRQMEAVQLNGQPLTHMSCNNDDEDSDDYSDDDSNEDSDDGGEETSHGGRLSASTTSPESFFSRGASSLKEYFKASTNKRFLSNSSRPTSQGRKESFSRLFKFRHSLDETLKSKAITSSETIDDAESLENSQGSILNSPSVISQATSNLTAAVDREAHFDKADKHEQLPPSWLRQISTTNCQEVPYQVTTRATPTKEHRCLQQLWLIKELKSPEQSAPIWSLCISADGRWIAAGVQNGTVYLWQTHESYKQDETSMPTNETLMTSYETIDLLTPYNRKSSSKGVELQQKPVNYVVHDDNQVNQQQQNESNFLFNDEPDLALFGHTATIVVCRWDIRPLPNHKNRLASASLDSTVRIWSIESIRTVDGEQFSYQSIVCSCGDWSTGVCFHPFYKDLIYTSALGGTIQVWSLPQGSSVAATLCLSTESEGGHVNRNEDYDTLADSNYALRNEERDWIPATFAKHPRAKSGELIEFTRMSELVTALTISPDGNLLSIGLRYGRVAIYESRSLRFRAEIECRNRKGRYSNGRKVTGLEWSKDGSSICVTTSDSRIRIISLNNLSSWLKFKGHVAKQMTHFAQFDPLDKHIICGSDSRWIFLWNVNPSSTMNSLVKSRLAMAGKKKPTNNQIEKFKAFDELLTACFVAPEKFSTRVVDVISNIQKKTGTEFRWKQLQDLIQDQQSSAIGGTGVPRKRAPIENFIIIAGSFKGTIRIFININQQQTSSSVPMSKASK